MNRCAAVIFACLLSLPAGGSAQTLRLAIAGLAHGHVSGFLNSAARRQDARVVAIFDPDPALVASYAKRYNLPAEGQFTDLAKMLDTVKPEAVATFTSTFDHVGVVEACAQRRIPVMMEKPLAVDMKQARAIQQAAARGGIPVIVNYETTWYRSHGEIWKTMKEEKAYAVATGGNTLRVRLRGQKEEETRTPAELPPDERDSISYLAAVVRGKLKPSGLSSLENNVIVTEILEAARESTHTGKTIV